MCGRDIVTYMRVQEKHTIVHLQIMTFARFCGQSPVGWMVLTVMWAIGLRSSLACARTALHQTQLTTSWLGLSPAWWADLRASLPSGSQLLKQRHCVDCCQMCLTSWLQCPIGGQQNCDVVSGSTYSTHDKTQPPWPIGQLSI